MRLHFLRTLEHKCLESLQAVLAELLISVRRVFQYFGRHPPQLFAEPVPGLTTGKKDWLINRTFFQTLQEICYNWLTFVPPWASNSPATPLRSDDVRASGSSVNVEVRLTILMQCTVCGYGWHSKKLMSPILPISGQSVCCREMYCKTLPNVTAQQLCVYEQPGNKEI